MDYDFSFFLVVSTFASGGIWGGYALWMKLRQAQTSSVASYDGVQVGDASDSDSQTFTEPLLVEYARSFFPILLIVLILRSFIVEPFRIPSGSMMPTLLVGDFILVNKFTYGVRLPVLNTKIIEAGEPARGDIVVFRFPKDPTTDYIKRVIGLPGDRIGYFNKQIFVNGVAIKQTPLGHYQGSGGGENMTGALMLSEDLEAVTHDILIREGQPSPQGEFTVPQGQYFVMGDNRDNSNDSRYWGTVPEANLVGRAFFIWMSFDWQNSGFALNRIGTVLK